MTLSTTRISLNDLIYKADKHGLTGRRAARFVDGLHRTAQALITSRYSFKVYANKLYVTLHLAKRPTDAELGFCYHMLETMQPVIENWASDRWMQIQLEKEHLRYERDKIRPLGKSPGDLTGEVDLKYILILNQDWS